MHRPPGLATTLARAGVGDDFPSRPSTALAEEGILVNPEAPTSGPSPASPVVEPPLRFGHYEVLRHPDGQLWELGKGAMGVTYKALDTRLKIEVVLKQIRPRLLEDERMQRLFLREARAAAKVRHPNIAAVIHLSDREPFFYTMEFVAGRSLADLLKKRSPLPVGEALNYADQVASALGALARERIVHRDLKPANLMLLADDEMTFGVLVKVIDFGLAKGFSDGGLAAQTHLAGDVSQSGIFSGTPFYASPEQCATQPDIDSRSDLYSLGVILWEMLTGTLPFFGTLGQVMAMHQFQPPPWERVADLPTDVREILRRLLEKDPAERFQNPRELREAIAICRTDSERRSLLAPGADSASAPEVDGTAESVATDVALGTRYRLVEAFPEGDGGRVYRAIDHAAGDATVAIKLLSQECATHEEFLNHLRAEIANIKASAQPMFLASPLELGEADAERFVVREWAEGFSLMTLLRARRTITPAEIQRLLAVLPEALDAAAPLDLEFTEPLLHKLFVTSNAGSWPRTELLSLRTRPLIDWPAFRLRWNPLNFRAPDDATMNEVTRVALDAELQTNDPVVALARLIRELLGGRPGGTTILSACSDHSNSVLRRALAPGGGRLTYTTAAEFWRAFFQADAVVPPPASTVKPMPVSVSRPASTSFKGQPPAALESRSPPPVPKKGPPFLMPATFIVVVAVGLIGWWKAEQRKRGASSRPRVSAVQPSISAAPVPPQVAPTVSAPTQNRPVVVAPAALAPTGAAAVAASGPPAAPPASSFENRLGMRFVPVAGTRVLFAARQTSRTDFATFLREAAYKSRGGAGEIVAPGASVARPDAQPVTNVTIDDARAFCLWLTQRERAVGRLGASQVYRLPNNFEWTMAGEGSDNRRSNPNRYGIMDLHGAISEWCEVPRGAGLHVIRGGQHPAAIPATSADFRSPSVGFRVVVGEGPGR